MANDKANNQGQGNSNNKGQKAQEILAKVAATKTNPVAQQRLQAIVQKFEDRGLGDAVDLDDGPVTPNTDVGLLYVGKGLALGRIKSLKKERVRGALVILDTWDSEEDRDKWIQFVNDEQVPFDPDGDAIEGMLTFQIPE